MTVVVQTPYNAHLANGVTTLFGFTFQLLDEGDLQVSLDGVVQVSGFTISGVGVQAGGSVTFSVAPANNVLVEIQRAIPLARSTDYQQNGDLPSATVDEDFDRIWQALQDAAYFAGLTVGLPAGDTAAPMVLPAVADRASRFFAFNALGEAIAALGTPPQVPVTAFAATLLDDVDASAARATLGAAQSGAVGTSGLTMAANRFLLRDTAGTGPVEEGTGAEAEALLPLNQTRTDVASAATVVVPTTTDHIQITGSTGPITGFTIAAGRTVFVRFTGAPTLTNNASIVTQSGANIAVRANDTCILRATAANVVEVLCYTRSVPESASLGANGWQRLPSGLILQWGSLSAASGANSVSFPLTFPTAVRSVVITAGGAGGGATNTSNAASLAASGFTLNNLTGVTNTFYWQAIGD